MDMSTIVALLISFLPVILMCLFVYASDFLFLSFPFQFYMQIVGGNEFYNLVFRY